MKKREEGNPKGLGPVREVNSVDVSVSLLFRLATVQDVGEDGTKGVVFPLPSLYGSYRL